MSTREPETGPATVLRGTARLVVPRPRTGSRPVTVRHAAQRPRRPLVPPRAWERSVVGGLFLVAGGVNLGVTAAASEDYAGFADDALLTGVRDLWRAVFENAPVLGGLGLVAGQLLIGVLLLAGGRAAPWGWAGAIGFHVLLLPFGLWTWPWALPALTLLVILARRDLAGTAPARGPGVPG